MALDGGELGKLIVSIEADATKLKKGLDDAGKFVGTTSNGIDKALKVIERSFFALGATAVAAMTLAIKSTVDYGEEIFKASERTGIATETLSKLKFVAEQTESSFESLTTGFKFLGKNIFEAANGNDKLAATFTALNIQIKDANGNLLDTDKVFLQVADKISGMSSEAEKTALAMRIFGRSGTDLIPVLNLGSKGIEELSKKAEELGLVLTKDNAKAIDEFSDKTKELKAAMGGVALTIGTQLIPILTDLVNFVNSNKDVFENINAFFGGKERGVNNQLAEAFKSANPELQKAREELVQIQEKIDEINNPSRVAPVGRLEALELNQLIERRNELLDLTADAQIRNNEISLGAIEITRETAAQEEELHVQRQLREEEEHQKIQQKVQDLFNSNNATLQFAQSIIALGKNIENSFSTALSGLITGELSAKKAAEELGRSLVKALADFVAQQVISATIGKALQAAELAAVRVFAIATGQAWAAPAALAATATLGGAAAQGGAALTGLIGFVKGLAAAAFAQGTDNIPALLSPGEMVVPKTFAGAIREGKLSLSGPAAKNNNESQPASVTIESIEVHVGGNLDNDAVPGIMEQIGSQIEGRLRGVV